MQAWLSACLLVLVWCAVPTQSAKRDDCDVSLTLFEKFDCDVSNLSVRCATVVRQLERNGCDVPTLSPPTTTTEASTTTTEASTTTTEASTTTTEASTTTTEAATTATELPTCYGLAPMRMCVEESRCDENLGYTIRDFVCSDSPADYVCCQESTEGLEACPVGTDGGIVTECITRTPCRAIAGSSMIEMMCGDGPEVCCQYPA